MRKVIFLAIAITIYAGCGNNHKSPAMQIFEYVTNSKHAQRFILHHASGIDANVDTKNVIGLYPYYVLIDFSYLNYPSSENNTQFLPDDRYDSVSIDSFMRSKKDLRIDKDLLMDKKQFTLFLTPPYKGLCYAILVDMDSTWISIRSNSLGPVSGSWLDFLFEIKDGNVVNVHEGEISFKN